MDKWVKKLAKLGRSSAEIVGFVKTIPKTPLDDVPKDSSDSGKREKGNALQQSGNIGSGTLNNKAAFLKLTDVAGGQEGKEISAQRAGNIGTGTSSVEIATPLSPPQSDSRPITQEQRDKGSEHSASAESAADTDGTADNKQQESVNTSEIGVSKSAEACPYCNSKEFTKRGTRKNKHQVVQLYECKNEECGRTFTAQDVKGRKFPLNVVIEGMSYYNLGFTLEQSCNFLKQKFSVPLPKLSSVEHAPNPKSQQSHGGKRDNGDLGLAATQDNFGSGTLSPNAQDSGGTFTPPTPETLSSWIKEYSQLCRYERLRPYAVKMYNPADVVEVVTMAHRQLFRFRYHRAKTRLMLEEEYRNRRLQPLKEFLDNISSVTPHQYFQEGERMSEIRSKFDKADMIVKSKFNYANRLADFVLQAVKDNKQRHEQLQRFFIANDSCTVATEVPVYIRKEDIVHFENDLRFKISDDGKIEIKGSKKPVELPKLLTGHIDFVQIRNGQVHLLDYKPDAAKEKPIEQLTWYALAMCRLTGLRLYDFTCAWFDEKDFFQFYPLHVVKKLQGKNRKKRKVFFKDGTWGEATKKDELVIVGRENNS